MASLLRISPLYPVFGIYWFKRPPIFGSGRILKGNVFRRASGVKFN